MWEERGSQTGILHHHVVVKFEAEVKWLHHVREESAQRDWTVKVLNLRAGQTSPDLYRSIGAAEVLPLPSSPELWIFECPVPLGVAFDMPLDIRISKAQQGEHPLGRVLRYVMVPTISKLVDNEPLISEGFDIPQKIIVEQTRAESRMRRTPATRDEVFTWLQSRPEVLDWFCFQARVVELSADGSDPFAQFGHHSCVLMLGSVCS